MKENVRYIRPKDRPDLPCHIVLRTRPNYTFCRQRLVGEWTSEGDRPPDDQLCPQCLANHTRQVGHDAARLDAWGAGEPKPESPTSRPGDGVG
jgi:hypothetical protein